MYLKPRFSMILRGLKYLANMLILLKIKKRINYIDMISSISTIKNM